MSPLSPWGAVPAAAQAGCRCVGAERGGEVWRRMQRRETALGRAHRGIAILPAAPAATINICCVPRSCQHMLSAALFPLPKPFRPATRLEC